jgi:hypothetical protein
MSITFKLYVNESPREKIGKVLSGEKSFDCLLKEDTSVLDPVLILESEDNLSGFNYMYCETFGRYYFIHNIESVGNNLWRITAHVDVLETYKSQILANTAILERQTNFYNTYLNDDEWPVYAYNDVITFKFTDSQFTKAANFILAVAGG